MLPSVLRSWRVPTLQIPIKAFKDGLQLVSKDNVLTHIQRYLTTDLQAGAIPPNHSVSVRLSSDVNLRGPEYVYFWEKLKKCFGFGSKKEGKGKSKSGKKTKKQTCKSAKGKSSKKKETCLKKKDSNICGEKAVEKSKADCKQKTEKKSSKADVCKKEEKKDANKADPSKKKEEGKADPCKKELKKADPCKKKEEKKEDPSKKKEDSCKKKEEKKKDDLFKNKEDPCKKKEDRKDDTCKKKDDKTKEDPCKKKEDPSKKKKENKDDPCKKKDDKKEDPCIKKDDKKKEDPCKKKEDPCKKKEDNKDDPCKKKDDKKKEDPCKKKEDPCKKKDEKKDDPCKKKEDPCKKKDEKKDDPCKKKEDPCKKKDEKKDDPCKKKEDPCKKKDDPCKKKDEKKDDPCKKKEDPCRKKEDPCKKKDEKKDDPCKKKEDPCKKKDDPCKKKDEKKDDPCKKREDPCKKEDPCGDKFVSNESFAMDPMLLFSLSQSAHKKEEEIRDTCKDPCAPGACDVLPGQDEPCGSSVSWKIKVNPCRQSRSSSRKSRCSSSNACIVDPPKKGNEKLEEASNCGLVAYPCGKKSCPNRCEVKKKKTFSSMQESFELGTFNFMNVLACQPLDIPSLAVNFASQRGTPINIPPSRPPSRNQPGAPGNPPAPGSVTQQVSGLIGKIKGLWNGPEYANPPKEKQQPKTTNMPVNTPGRSPSLYPTKQRCEGLETKSHGDFGLLGENTNLPELSTDSGLILAIGPQDDFEKCEDRKPPCPVEIDTFPCPKEIEPCEKTTDEIWSDIDESYGYEKFPFKQEQMHGTPMEIASLTSNDPYANHRL